MYFDIMRCGLDRWTGLWGDPLWTGAILTATLFGAAILSTVLANRRDKRERLFWVFTAMTTVALAMNVHLDLHILPNAIGRCAASAQGWVHLGQTVQAVFVVTAFVLGGAAVAVVIWTFRKQFKKYKTVFFGFVLMVGALAVKGAGLRMVAGGGYLGFAALAFDEALETTGAALITLGAFQALRRSAAGPHP